MPGGHAGKIVAIMGGAGGIGHASVQRLGREGARVARRYIRYIRYGRNGEVARQAGSEAAGYQVDISDWEQMCCFATKVRSRFGDPSIVIHCAAMQFTNPFEELSTQQWRATVDVNALDGS